MRRFFSTLCILAATTAMISCNKPAETTNSGAADSTAKLDSATSATYEYYGDSIATADAISIADLYANTANQKDSDTLKTRITGEIVESCPNKGCWVSVKAPNDEVLVLRFKGYKFFVPTEGLGGKTLVAEGVSHWETTSVEDLKKEAKEAGKSAKEIAAITKPERYLEFLASGVAIKN